MPAKAEELVEVTQADREAAACYWESQGIGTQASYRAHIKGTRDDSDLVQLLARHRHKANSKVNWAETVERETARLLSESFTNGRLAGLEETRASIQSLSTKAEELAACLETLADWPIKENATAVTASIMRQFAQRALGRQTVSDEALRLAVEWADSVEGKEALSYRGEQS